MVGKGVNSGIYADFKDDDLIEYSAILDGRTTAGCSYLHKKRMTWQEWKQQPDMIPPRHFGCRATLIRVVAGGETGENAPDAGKLAKKDEMQNTSKKELVASGKIAENETKKAALARIKNDEFVLPEKTKIAKDQALKGTNPNYPTSREYRINCQRCVPTYEMRRRGYDVEALPNIDGSMSSIVDIRKMWGADPNELFRNYKLKEGTENQIESLNFEFFEYYLNSMNDGERYQIGWVWKNNSGHTIMVEKLNKKLVFIDPQSGKIRDFKAFSEWVKNADGKFWALRIDNRNLDEDMIKLIMKGR